MTIQEAFEIMLSGKSVRITKELRKEVKSNRGNYFTDTWFNIGAVHADETLTICGNNHTIIKGVELNQISK